VLADLDCTNVLPASIDVKTPADIVVTATKVPAVSITIDVESGLIHSHDIYKGRANNNKTIMQTRMTETRSQGAHGEYGMEPVNGEAPGAGRENDRSE